MKEYRITLSGREIGHTSFEDADPPMGVVSGLIRFTISNSPYLLFRDYCRSNGITMNEADDITEFIDTWVIPELRVYREDGLEIAGCAGAGITGFKEEGYKISVLGIPYPFYGEEFPHHRDAYEKAFK
jgi:hypothetical protein